MIKLFRLALVGAGMITQGSHLPAALASSKVKVVAIVDPVQDRATTLARSYGINPKIVPQVQDILNEIDGALIATPNDTHRDIAIACLEAGVSTLIDKPLASTYEDGMAIIQTAEKTGAVVAVGYCTRFRENILFLHDLLKTGHFGTVKRFAHQFGTPGGWAPMSAYNLNRKAAGGGVLIVTGSHFLDRMLYLWGFPDEAELKDDSEGGPEANCMATFRYTTADTPFEGVALYSKTAALPGGLVIETDKGIVKLADMDDADIIFRPHVTPEIEEVVRRRGKPIYPPGVSVFQLQLDDFVDACQQRRSPRVDGYQGLNSLKLIQDLYSRRQSIINNPPTTLVESVA